MFKIYNIDDKYEYAHEYETIAEAEKDIKEYELEDIKDKNIVDNYVIIDNETGDQVFNSLDEAEKLLTKYFIKKFKTIK